MDGVTNVIEVFRRYNGETWFFPLFLAAVAWLLIRLDKRNRRSALLTIAAACLFVFNQAAFVLAGKVIGTETYYRFLWMIPVIPMLAYAAVDVIVLQKNIVRRTAAAAAVLAAVVLAGVPYAGRGSFVKPGQVSYLNRESAEICELISEDKEKKRPRVACDSNLVRSLRLQDPTIRNVITRQTYRFDSELELNTKSRIVQHRLLTLVEGGTLEISSKKLQNTLTRSKADYLVIATEYHMDEQLLAAGCRIIGQTDSYTIYRVE